MKNNIILLKLARIDLEEINIYYSKISIKHTKLIYSKLLLTFETLAKFPKFGKQFNQYREI